MLIAQDMREADQEFVRSGMQRIEEETCLRFQEKEGVQPYSHPSLELDIVLIQRY